MCIIAYKPRDIPVDCHTLETCFESDSFTCGGCREALLSVAHHELGWCDDCGFEIYGGKWPAMLRAAAGVARPAWTPGYF